MRIEFEYSLDDLKEGVWWRRRVRSVAVLLAWLVLLECGAIAIWFGQPHQATINVQRDWPAMLPWVAVPLVIVLPRRYQLHRYVLQMWKSHPAFQLPHSVEFDDQGVRVTSSLIDTRYSWNYFVSWTQSPNLLLLVMPPEMRLIIPKRAFSGEPELSQLCAFIDAHVQKPTHGFPLSRVARSLEA